MRKIILNWNFYNSYPIIFLFVLFLFLNSGESFGQEKLSRAKSFFGWHFDFHATAKDLELGKNFDAALLDTFLLRTHPDYIQIDSKGHWGYSSYPTKAGYSANSFVKDPIRIWKDMADKHNIPLYVHYSGLWDEEAIRQNPEWGRLNADGARDKSNVGYFSEYSDKLLIPQLLEMIDSYKIDGAWIDGDCWTALPDYSPQVIKDFLAESGLPDVPRDPEDDNFELWKQFNRNTFKQYLRHYIDEVHRYKPGFQITSNWAFSSIMPEPVDIKVDFLSGDVAGSNCVYSAAFEARCMSLQGKSWDLMSWGMIPVNFWGAVHTPKPVVQLKQEAAEVMAMGGGYQVYFRQNRDGAFQTLDTEGLEGLAKFVRKRQPFCQYSEIIPQIGLWYSLEGWREEGRTRKNIYGAPNLGLKGVFNLLLDGQHSVEVLMDHHLEERMDKYPLIIVPEWTAFNEVIKAKLLSYVKEGGNLLVIGAKAVRHYSDLLNVRFEGKDTTGIELMVGGRNLGGIAGFKTQWQPVKVAAGTEEIGEIYSQTDYRYATGYPVATVNKYGKGKIGAVYVDVSSAHGQYRNPVFNNIISRVIKTLIPEPALRVMGSDEVHTMLGKKNGHILIHLINSSGHHSNRSVFGYNELRLTPALTVYLKVNERPQSIIIQPAGRKLKFEYNQGYIRFSVPPVEVYDIVEIIP